MTSLILKAGCDTITLAQALKASGQVQSGGEAKMLVRAGNALVNGEVSLQVGRKLRAGDNFGLEGAAQWSIANPVP